ncbi:MAG: class 1b ribonucleoside-diphosphate reductase subunit alpha [Mycoplasmataceae bacterium]|nr:class 1b ribonucleoside-diphosphate reductase subunit alpha [Mycoplasmataceae bacterium]
MKLVYYSVTGNTQKIADKLDKKNALSISEGLIINEPFVLITSSTGFGEVQEEITKFLQENHKNLKGVIGSGNRNWGANFCKASKVIANKYNVPYIYGIELAGTTHDIENTNKELAKMNNNELKHIELNNQVKIEKNGFFQLDKDLEARDAFLELFDEKYHYEVNQFTRINSLVKKGLYNKKIIEWYSMEQINDLDNYVRSFNHNFKSYMAAKKFLNEYTLKSYDKKINYENYNDRVVILGLYLGQGNYELAKKITKEVVLGNYQPATPTMQDAGRWNSGEMVSCFLLEMDDNLNSINYVLGTSMNLSKFGGGVAVNVSKIRSRGSSLRNVKGITAGIMPILKLLEDSFSFANKMDQRNGAGAAYLNVFHWDVLEFLDTKKINADEKNRIQSLALGLIIQDKMFELAKEGKQMAIFSPYDVKKEYGIDLDDMDINKMYDQLVVNEKVNKQFVSPRKLLLKIAQTQLESGYPYIVYKDNANRVHPLKNLGDIKMSNLCTEIFQFQETSKIKNYYEKDEIKHDVSCILGSLNIVNVIENKSIKETVDTAMDALTAVVELTNIETAPGIKLANDDLHSVGLGTLNLHGFFAKNNIMYESEQAKDFVNVFFATINYYSLKRSMEIAKEKNKVFWGFDKSEYANGNYFINYLNKEFKPQTEKIKTIFNDFNIPSIDDWKQLKKDVIQNGIYHAYRMAIAPNQSTAYIANATPSVMPITNMVESRTYGNSTTYYPMPYLKQNNKIFYKSAFNMDQEKIIDLVATIQQHVDQGIATILFVNSNTSTRDLAKLYLYGYKKGLKALYYTRTKNLKIDECESCYA